MALKLRSEEVLRYYPPEDKLRGRPTIRRHYVDWREENGLPKEGCDNEGCQFHSGRLVWNGKPLRPILDHRDGNARYNRPTNLRFLCPNCDSQELVTRGGANRHRVENASGGYAVLDKKTGKRHYRLPANTGHFVITGHDAELRSSR